MQYSTRYWYVIRDILTYSRWTSSLPSCLWSLKDLLISPRFTPYDFLSRSKFSTLTTRQPQWLNFTYSRSHAFRYASYEKKNTHFPCLGCPEGLDASMFFFSRNTNPADKNRTHDFRTSRCAGNLLDHSGDEQVSKLGYLILVYSAAFSSHLCFLCVLFSFILDIKFVGRTSRGHTGGRSHRIQPFLSLVDREVEFCVLTI